MKINLIIVVAFLITACSSETKIPNTPTPILLTSTPDPFCQPYEKALSVYQDGENVVAKNNSTSPITARISWDGKDPFAEGKEGSDSYVTESPLEPQQSFSREINSHLIADVWAWNVEGKCIDQFSLIILR